MPCQVRTNIEIEDTCVKAIMDRFGVLARVADVIGVQMDDASRSV